MFVVWRITTSSYLSLHYMSSVGKWDIHSTSLFWCVESLRLFIRNCLPSLLSTVIITGRSIVDWIQDEMLWEINAAGHRFKHGVRTWDRLVWPGMTLEKLAIEIRRLEQHQQEVTMPTPFHWLRDRGSSATFTNVRGYVSSSYLIWDTKLGYDLVWAPLESPPPKRNEPGLRYPEGSYWSMPYCHC